MTQKQMQTENFGKNKKNQSANDIKTAEKIPRKTGYIVVIVLLLALLILTNLFAYFGVLQKILPTTTPAFVLGQSATIDAKENSSNAICFSFNGSAVTGIFYQHPIFVKIPVTDEKLLIRAKMQIQTEQGERFVQIATDTNWTQGQDGYVYFDNFAQSGQNILLSNGYVLPNFVSDQHKSYNLCVIVETLSESTNFKEIWALPQDFEIIDQTTD